MCSRREADRLIEAGRVTINGKPTKKGNRVNDGDEVAIDSVVINQKSKLIYIAYNKPVGIVSTTDLREKNNIVQAINHPERLFPIGRLDKASEGLIFLTNDGNIVNKILRAGNKHEKEYIVTVDKRINQEFISKMSNGLPILDTITKQCKVEKIGEYTFRIILTQGLNRQIRRMCEVLNYRVKKLKRIRIMNVRLGRLQPGTWRVLTNDEMTSIYKAISGSKKTEEASFDPGKQFIKKKKRN